MKFMLVRVTFVLLAYRKLPNNSAAEETIQPTSTRGKTSSLLSLTVAYICLAIALIILRDTLSWLARSLITHSHMFISGSSLAFFLKLSLIFSPFSLTLLGSTEKRLAAASPEFSSAYFVTESLNFKYTLKLHLFLLNRS